jgi:hypothetical protein
MKTGAHQTFVAKVALPMYRLVVVGSDSGVMKADLAVADATVFHGVTNSRAEIGEQADVVLLGHGQVRMTAAAAITIGATVYPAAAGKVSTTAGTGKAIGVAMQAASGDNVEILVLPNF